MSSRVYLRDIEVLHNLDTELSQFNHGANAVLESTARDIKASQERLKARVTYWQAELRRRQNEYDVCRRRGKDSCHAESIAVQQAQDALGRLKRLSSRLEQAVGEYLPHANRLQQVLGEKLSKAKRDLGRSVGKYQAYLDQTSPGYGFKSSSSPSVYPERILDTSSTNDSSIGSFSICDWKGYPSGSKPSGPFKILRDEEYETARKEANAINRAMHQADPSLKGLEIHEIHPVKFGGSPIDPGNKIPVTRLEHAKYTTWWNRFLQNMSQR
jgi:hypothetical protein